MGTNDATQIQNDAMQNDDIFSGDFFSVRHGTSAPWHTSAKTAAYSKLPSSIGNSPWWAPRRTLSTGAARVVSAHSTAVLHLGHAYVSLLVHQHQWTFRPERAALAMRFS